MSDRRERRQRTRHTQRVAKHEAKADYKRHNAPKRIRGAATTCFIFGVLAILGGLFDASGTPKFGGDAYTEMVAQLATISRAVGWLAAVVLFTGGALLKALADVLDELRWPAVGGNPVTRERLTVPVTGVSDAAPGVASG